MPPTAVSPTVIPEVSPALLARYDVPGPRYTSYPAVPDWRGALDGASWARHLAALGRPDAGAHPLALYLHLPFCAARCLYCGCNATVTTRRAVVDRHLDRLAAELALVGGAIGARPRVAELHWGGGTPNFLEDDQLERMYALLAARFDLTGAACSVEADPRLVTRSQLERLVALGFRRISFGVQDLDPRVQAAIGRVQPEAQVREAVALARAAGFTGLNVDLIYGLPLQTPDTFRRTIDGALALAPDRVACFGYAHVPWMRPHQKRIDADTLPVAWDRFTLFRAAVQGFTAAGYRWLGIDHFALPADPLAQAADAGALHRNFMGYTTRPGERLLGIGMSAISEVDGWLAQHQVELGDWQRAIDDGQWPLMRGHVLSADDRRRGAAIAHLMCNAELPRALWLEDDGQFEARLAPLRDDGLVVLEPGRLVVTPLGRFFLRNIAFLLDGYRAGAEPVARYSRAV
ncbi:MAG: hypothetical protein RLZ32_2293 [Gemmatimonadota bacterium]